MYRNISKEPELSSTGALYQWCPECGTLIPLQSMIMHNIHFHSVKVPTQVPQDDKRPADDVAEVEPRKKLRVRRVQYNEEEKQQ